MVTIIVKLASSQHKDIAFAVSKNDFAVSSDDDPDMEVQLQDPPCAFLDQPTNLRVNGSYDQLSGPSSISINYHGI